MRPLLDLALAGFLIAGLLAACASTPAPQAQCLPLKTYTPAQSQALAAAVAALPPGSPLIGAVADYGALRAADRACLSIKP